MHPRTNLAVSEIIGLIFVLIIVTTASFLVLSYGTVQLSYRKDAVRTITVLKQFSMMNEVINDIVSQDINASRIVNIVTEEGAIQIEDQTSTRVIFFYSLEDRFDFSITGLDDGDRRFNLLLADRDPSAIYPCC